MNLTPKSWNMGSEITADTVLIGDEITYIDACNFQCYKVVEVDNNGIVIADKKTGEWVDYKSFSQLNKRWTFIGEAAKRLEFNKLVAI